VNPYPSEPPFVMSPVEESEEDADRGMYDEDDDPLEDAYGYSRSDLLFGGNW
jgi:hypothetical protein